MTTNKSFKFLLLWTAKYPCLQSAPCIRLCKTVLAFILLTTSPIGSAIAATAPPLGTAGGFAVLGASTVTNTGSTSISGSLGLSPGTSITGFPPGNVIGATHAADALAASAQLDATSAYSNLTGQSCTTNYGSADKDLAGLTLSPGVYCFLSSAQISTGGTLTLDGLGNANAVWIFQMGSTLTTFSGASVVLINGAQQSNIFWPVGSSATLGTTTLFKGTIIAQVSITLNTSATVSGRVLALNGAVTLDSNTVSAPQPSISISKSVLVFSDPINASSNPKAIPGAVMNYTIAILNSGTGPVDGGTMVITDPIPANVAMFVSDINGANSGPAVFLQGSPSSDLVYKFTELGSNTDDLDFSSDGGSTWAYVPTPGADGCDPLVTNLRINPKGLFVSAASPPSPGFALNFRVCVK
jgi:uncharacterized repeat protein (TIGR01451 family)